MCIHKAFIACIPKTSYKKNIFGTAVSILLTYIFVRICWVFCRTENISNAFFILHRIFIWQDGVMQPFTWVFAAIVLVAAGETAAYLRSRKQCEAVVNGFYPIMDLTIVRL